MRLYVDSVALIALGEIESIDLLRHFPSQTVITPTIREEVRDSASQVDRALLAGWMTIETQMMPW